MCKQKQIEVTEVYCYVDHNNNSIFNPANRFIVPVNVWLHSINLWEIAGPFYIPHPKLSLWQKVVELATGECPICGHKRTEKYKNAQTT